ncbi:MAG: EAL domain-containing protein [Acidimicrobiia bacterium]|nr:EAL domain-containing protein [Acidimicrobiia bacterium]
MSTDETVTRSVGDGGSRDPLDVLTEFDVRALSSPVGIFRGTAADGILRVNQHFLDITGLIPTAARGWDWLVAVHADDRDRLRRAIDAACQTGAKSAFPIRMQVELGVIETLRITLGATPSPDGSWVFVGAVESETNPPLPRASEHEGQPVDVDASDPFEVLVATMPIALAYAAPDGIIEYANDAWHVMTGFGADTVLADALGTDVADVDAPVVAAIAAEGASSVVASLDGRSVQISVVPIAPRLGGGQVVTLSEVPGAVLGPELMDEVTQPEPVTAAADDTRPAWDHSETTLRTLMRAAPAAIFAVDTDGRIQLWNPGCEALLGWSADDVIGELPPFLSEEQRSALSSASRELLAGTDVAGEATFRRRDGSRVVVALSAAPIMTPEGALASVVTVAVDVTERVDATAELERRAQIERLIASLSHSLMDATPSTIDARAVEVLGALARNYGATAAAVYVRGTETPDHLWPNDAEAPSLSLAALPTAGGFLDLGDDPTAPVVGGWVVAGDGGPVGVLALLLRDPEDVTLEDLAPLDLVGGSMIAAIERVRAELEVRTSELRFRRLAEHANDWVVVVGADLDRRYLSPAAARFLGLSEDAEFAPERSLVHEDDLAATTERMAAIAAEPIGSQTEPFVARFRRADGEYRWAELQVTNLLGDAVVDGLIINAHDVTDGHLAEERLRESEGRFRSLVQNLAEGVIVLAADGSVKYASPSAARMVGFEEGQGQGAIGLDFVIEADRERAEAIVAESFAGPGIHGPVKLRIRGVEGEIRVIEAMGHNRLDDPQIEGVVVTARDITESVEAGAAARRSDARLRALVENLSDVVTIVGADGQIVYTSPAALELFGYEDSDSSWTDPTSRVHPDDRARMVEAMAANIATGSVEPVRFRLQGTDGVWHDVEAIARDMSDDPEIGGVVVTTRDISARVRAETLVSDQARILTLIARGAPLETTLSTLCEVLERHVEGSTCGVLLVDPERQVLRLGAGPRIPMELAQACEDIQIGGTEDAFGSTAALGSTAVVLDIDADPRSASLREVARRCGVAGVWSTPVFDSNAQGIIGTLAIFFDHSHEPTALEREVVLMFSQTAAIAIERQVAEDLLAHRANHDSLTRLPNRALFLEFLTLSLARAQRDGGTLAVLFLDLDRFKHINDGLGHDAGDELLAELARRLRDAMRPSDVVARFGGDEFTVLCEGLDPARAEEQAREVARRLLAAIEAPISLEGEDRKLSASLGIALATPGSTAEGLLRDADAAMYSAKEHGKAQVEIFDDAMRSNLDARLDLESQLERALERDEFRLFLQPIVDLRSGRCTGAEALLRWQNPDRGLVTPDAFIGLAEETGLIIPIGEWALAEACRTVARWDEVGLLSPEFTMAVNLSARQVAQADLAEKVRAVIERSGPMSSRLCLEITESVLMEDSSVEAMQALRDLGVRLSIDDFGTGYSSLGYLKRFPVDSVKIDRSFVDGLGTDSEDSAIVTAVVSLGHALGLSVVAEGVETSGQLQELLRLGCDRAQGYWFSGPRDQNEFAALLHAQPWIDGRDAWTT